MMPCVISLDKVPRHIRAKGVSDCQATTTTQARNKKKKNHEENMSEDATLRNDEKDSSDAAPVPNAILSSSSRPHDRLPLHDADASSQEQPQQESFVLPLDYKPGQWDVVFGQSGTYHGGNAKFNELIEHHAAQMNAHHNNRDVYVYDGQAVASVLHDICARKGKFVFFSNGFWYEANQAMARVKIEHAFRDLRESRMELARGTLAGQRRQVSRGGKAEKVAVAKEVEVEDGEVLECDNNHGTPPEKPSQARRVSAMSDSGSTKDTSNITETSAAKETIVETPTASAVAIIPNNNDILLDTTLGRFKSGNPQFLQLIKAASTQYALKGDAKVQERICSVLGNFIRSRGGRFLCNSTSGNNNNNQWEELADSTCRNLIADIFEKEKRSNKPTEKSRQSDRQPTKNQQEQQAHSEASLAETTRKGPPVKVTESSFKSSQPTVIVTVDGSKTKSSSKPSKPTAAPVLDRKNSNPETGSRKTAQKEPNQAGNTTTAVAGKENNADQGQRKRKPSSTLHMEPVLNQQQPDPNPKHVSVVAAGKEPDTKRGTRDMMHQHPQATISPSKHQRTVPSVEPVPSSTQTKTNAPSPARPESANINAPTESFHPPQAFRKPPHSTSGLQMHDHAPGHSPGRYGHSVLSVHQEPHPHSNPQGHYYWQYHPQRSGCVVPKTSPLLTRQEHRHTSVPHHRQESHNPSAPHHRPHVHSPVPHCQQHNHNGISSSQERFSRIMTKLMGKYSSRAALDFDIAHLEGIIESAKYSQNVAFLEEASRAQDYLPWLKELCKLEKFRSMSDLYAQMISLQHQLSGVANIKERLHIARKLEMIKDRYKNEQLGYSKYAQHGATAVYANSQHPQHRPTKSASDPQSAVETIEILDENDPQDHNQNRKRSFEQSQEHLNNKRSRHSKDS